MDSLMQHAIFLADSADRFLEATNNLWVAQDEYDEDYKPEKLEDAELAYNAAFDKLRYSIYDFRKRLKP
jgi:hypothetical protein